MEKMSAEEIERAARLAMLAGNTKAKASERFRAQMELEEAGLCVHAARVPHGCVVIDGKVYGVYSEGFIFHARDES